MRDTDLLRRLRLFGLDVVEVDGWRTRGTDTLDLKGGVNHHTAGPAPKPGRETASLQTVINGRPDLAGPLCNVYLGRDNRAYLVAAGKANHAGVGKWKGVTGNSHFFGLEAEHSGLDSEPITPEFVELMCRIQAAAALGHYGAEMVAQHCEYATPRGRKPDFCCSRLDKDLFRARVAQLLAHPPGSTPADPGGFLMALSDADQTKLLELTKQNNVLLTSLNRVVVGADQTPDNPNGAAKGTMLGRIRDGVARIEAAVKPKP